ncbi:hypothetical protein CEUSTIGMA_g10861.t1 [Chlamydomonas eustigma]|uniref:Uncharacterized protein n=1 Tax=Chlamydomonas eustigma TaxID=1157962 RepID=A0A250XK89_9CHLO|nr:hypothetical protein CEUSTIGMA_g10861.t1 [Chlamydomonas eustigma]|eukprot:GAX83436.1 hypothetical protein CEUSTIGMA_g10861.t1 [Chlamydomonas eustigma]
MKCFQASVRSGFHSSVHTTLICATRHARRVMNLKSSKGFGTETSSEKAQEVGAGSSEAVENLEEKIRNRRGKKGGKVEPQVKVNAPVVDAVTGKAPATPESQYETAAVLTLFYFFLAILVEGLLLAGSGFFPEEWDQFIQDKIYPSYSPTVLLFLSMSSFYGLFKTGKLPGQKQL